MENKTEEQLETIQSIAQEETLTDAVEDSSNSYGKFKSAEELIKAYNNLEREFTKRSQKLKLLEKNTINATEPKQEEYRKDNWQEKVDNFLKNNPAAIPFKKDIAREILDGNLSDNPACLELAMSRVLLNNYKAPSSLADDEEFLDNHIYKNEKIRDKIIKDYLSGISNARTVKTIGTGGQPVLSPRPRPKTISEAGKMVIEMAGRGK